MSILRLICFWGFSLAFFATASERSMGSLDYRVKIRFQGDPNIVETRFSLIPTPVATTANRVKKARMGAWRLEAQQPKNAPFSQAMILARVERMLYFSGPTEQTLRQNLVVRFGEKACRIWNVPAPKGVAAYAYLAEVAPGLLALSYFSGAFTSGDVASLEIQLEGFRLDPGAAPSEDGTQLLRSLQRLGLTPARDSETGVEQIVQ
ncbi:MAG: hypothetical protein Q8O00_11745 [Holophaga sp.]|nr:hypothetical protein [Holophaga sp.]